MARKKRKSMGKSKAERDAWDAHVDQTLRRLRTLVERGWAELEKKNPELKNL